MNILVIDHSKVFRSMWQRMALSAGHDSITVATGEEGLDALREHPVDAVCVALTLADFDGVEFCRRVRGMSEHTGLPIILTTTSGDASVRQAAFEANATDVQPRTHIEDLLQRVIQLGTSARPQCSGRVLYVEDSPTVAVAMLRVFEEMSLEVDHYTSASEAYTAYDPDRYDLIVSDILVEGEMSGLGLVGHIREISPESMRMPILAISGMEDPNRRIELFQLGINDFVTKPMLEQEVRARVRNLITNKQLLEQVEEQRQHLYELATTDQLTGLYSRNALAELLSRPLASANRHDLDLSLVMLDLDHFKFINDNHGHLVGDEVLAALGELVLTQSRAEDYAIRFGGEELVIVLPHCDIESAWGYAERLRNHTAALQPAGLDVTTSIGVAARQRGSEATLEGLIQSADQAVYLAKHNGRNRIERARPGTSPPQTSSKAAADTDHPPVASA